MKGELPSGDQLRALLERWCEGEQEESLAAQISTLVRANPDLAWDYLCFMEMHATLRYQEQEESGLPTSSSAGGHAGPAPAGPGPLPALAIERADAGGPLRSNGALRWPWMAVACAGVLGTVAAALFFLYSWRAPTEPAVVQTTPMAPVVARLASAFDCTWQDAAAARRVGDSLREGDTLALATGFARIAFQSGAVLTLQAPARVVLKGTNGVVLDRGTVTSEVPKQARGFTVETASSRIVDFGTEFGVAVDETGSTALSVFRGMVEIAGRHRDALPARRVTAGQAIRLDHVGEMAEWREVDPSRLAPGCCDRSGAVDPNALPVSVRRFRHAAELVFPDKVVAAINVGGIEPLEVSGVRFEGDLGKHAASPCSCEQWGMQPYFGDASDDVTLSRLLHSIRHNLYRGANRNNKPDLKEPIRVVLPVEEGRYRVSLLLSENYHARAPTRDRSLNVDVEGRCVARDLRILAVQGIAGYPVPPNQAIVLATEVDVADAALDVLLFSRHVADDVDENVILNALVVERLDAPGTNPSHP